jgi:hypothetical protein
MMSKLFDLEVIEGTTSCSTCPFVHCKYVCTYLSQSQLCSQYDFTQCRIKESANTIVRFGDVVSNEDLQKCLQKHPSDAIVAMECCNPNTMRYNKEDNTIRID